MKKTKRHTKGKTQSGAKSDSVRKPTRSPLETKTDRFTKQAHAKVDLHHDPRWYKRPSFVVSTAISIVSLFIGALIFMTKVVINGPDTPALKYNPLTSTFTIINDSIIPLWDVHIGIAVCQIGSPPEWDPQYRCDFTKGKSILDFSRWKIDRFSSGAMQTITPDDLLKYRSGTGEIIMADLGIWAQYRPWFIPWNEEHVFRFHTVLAPNGDLRWFATP